MRWWIVLSVFLNLFFSPQILAKTHYVLFDINADETSNQYVFYNDTRRAYESIRAAGQRPQVFAKDGTWRVSQWTDESLSTFHLTPEGKKAPDPNQQQVITYPPVSGGIRNRRDIKSAIESLKIKEGDQLVIQIVGHGLPPSSSSNLEESTLIGWQGELVSFQNLSEVLKGLPKGVSTKLITNACYSGTIHQISRDLPNVCSVSPTTYHQVTRSGYGFETEFLKQFWMQFSGSSPRRFGQSALYALLNDSFNRGNGNLSSFDYIDWVLKKGQHRSGQEVMSVEEWFSSDSETILKKFDPQKDVPNFGSINTIETSTKENSSEGGVCVYCSSSLIQQDLSGIDQKVQLLRSVFSPGGPQVQSGGFVKSPMIQTVFEEVVEDMKKNGESYLQLAKAYEERFSNLKAHWEAEKSKLEISKGSTLPNDSQGVRAKYQSEFDKLSREAEGSLKKYYFNHQILNLLEKLKEFDRVANSDQKRKLKELLECEWREL